MDGYTLRSVVQSLEYPTTIRIVKGSVTSEEGKCFSDKDNNVLTLYSRGLRVYVPPVTNASLRRRYKDTNNLRRTSRYKSADYGAKNLVTNNVFVSANAKLRYNTFVCKVYTHVSDILVDLPYAVKVNQPIFGCVDDGNITMIATNDVILVDQHGISPNILSGRVKGHNIQITSDCIDATSMPGPNTPILITTADALHKDSNWQPKEMVFEDEDVQDTYEVEIGFNVLPLSEQPLLSVCCASGKASTLIEGIDNHMLKIKNVWCLHIRVELMDGVKVQIIDTDTRSAFRTEFGKEVGRDSDGFSMYNLYGKSSGYIEHTAPQGEPPRLPRRSARHGSVRQTDLHHPLPYDEALQKHSSPIFVNSFGKKNLSSNEEHMESSLRQRAINQLTDDYIALDYSPLTSQQPSTNSTSLTSQQPSTNSKSLTSQQPSTNSTSLTDADYLESTPRLCPDVPGVPVETHPPLPWRSTGGGSVRRLAVTPPTSISESLLVDDEALLEEVFIEDEHMTQGLQPSKNKAVNDAAAASDDEDDNDSGDDGNDDGDDGGDDDSGDGGDDDSGDGSDDGGDDDSGDGSDDDSGNDGNDDDNDDDSGDSGGGDSGDDDGADGDDTTTYSPSTSHKTKSVLPIHGNNISSDEHKLLEHEDTPIGLMKISELANMFRKYKLDRVAEICEEHVIDGTILSDLEEDDLMNEPFNLKGYALKRVLLIQKGHRPK